MSSVSKSVLLVEDEPNVALTLKERLVRDGYHVTHAAKMQDALQLLSAQQYTAAIVDVGLPDGSGFTVAREMRRLQPACAVIFLSAFSDPDYRIEGLELGAEDYIVKPFHLKELILRLNNACKRAHALIHEQGTGEIELGKAVVRLANFEVIVAGEVHHLSHKECSLLKFLLDRRGKVVSRDEILNFVWADDEYPTPRTIDNFIVKLRRLIEFDPNEPTLIKSVRGVGYQLTEEK